MTPFPVPHRWLATLLGVALLLDTMIVLGSHPPRMVLSIPAVALFAACAWVGVRRPALGAALGAITLIVSSALMRFADVNAPSIVLPYISLTEVISGVVLVVMVVWRTAPIVSVPAVLGLVVACLFSIAIRSMSCVARYCYESNTFALFSPSNLFMTGVVGFLLLAGSAGTGVYLRWSARQRVETEMGALVRKQWPLGAALAVLALLELSDSGIDEIIGLGGAAIVGVLAFFGPKYPLRNALLAAGVLVFTGVLEGVGGITSDWPFSPTASAACMALIAYVVRYLRLREAIWGTATLTVALGIFMAARGNSAYLGRDDGLFLMIVLLLVAIATGWYFRARDRERNQTVKAAVTSAQQGERMALARELHDVVAHHVTGIVVQAQAALMVAGKNPDVALPALAKIERSGTEALTAMRTLVGSLREGTAAWTAAYADATGDATTDLAADLRSVVENFTGPPVEVELDLPADLPHEMGRSVLRLVQESLTNVGKHAPDASVVRVRVAQISTQLDDALHIRVSDDGTKRPANPAGGSGGYGLVGMRERVELLGGRFEAGPSGYVGWNVEAWLPLRKEGT